MGNASERCEADGMTQRLEAVPTADPFEHMHRIRSVDKAKETIYVPRAGFSPLLGREAGGGPLELVLHEMWCVANLRIKSATVQGDSVALTFHNPEENGYLIHLDDETGPGGTLDDYQWPLVLELPDVWEYAPVEW